MPQNDNSSSFQKEFGGFEKLMPFRIRNILLVASLYDSFLLADDENLNEALFGNRGEGYAGLPAITRVSTAEEAINALKNGKFDLVISMLQPQDADIDVFFRRIKDIKKDIAVVYMAFNVRDANTLPENAKALADGVFLWNGDTRIFSAIINVIEDTRNFDSDSRTGVQAVLLVEDNVKFYSSYLPIIYNELLNQTRLVMDEELNPAKKNQRMNARPKVLFCSDYAIALALYGRFTNNILGVITDVEYPCAKKLRPMAGLDFAHIIKTGNSDMPVLIQSSDPSHARAAEQIKASFMDKNSQDISGQLRNFIKQYFGFGDFIFRSPEGAELARATDLLSMIRELRRVPLSSIMYHSERNHFSKWLLARTEFEIAYLIRPQKTSEFDNSPEKIRDYLIETIYRFLYKNRKGTILKFDRRYFENAAPFFKIGNGSIGGKARGLAFVDFLLSRNMLGGHWDNVRISVPNSVVISSDVFDFFMEQNLLEEKIANAKDDSEIEKIFLEARLPDYLISDLEVLVGKLYGPLAVRSSSLLEDSRTQPFAGVYKTFMLPNIGPDKKARLAELEKAVKLVYASVFSKEAVSYRKMNPYVIDDEKMAVIIQKVVGRRHKSGYFYPAFSGVLQSYNYYPLPPLKEEEPVAFICSGLGEAIVGGSASLRFSPAHPGNLHQFATVKSCFETSQKEIRALDLSENASSERGAAGNVGLGIRTAEMDGLMPIAGSVYNDGDDRIYPWPGEDKALNCPRLLTFAPILKQGRIPLAEILVKVAKMGKDAMGCHIEAEFSADWDPDSGILSFYILQMRPMTSRSAGHKISLDGIPDDRLFLRTAKALGNGIYEGISDILFVPPEKFSPELAFEIAQETGHFNSELCSLGRKSMIIGPGRWGTSDRNLGIPVKWNEISSASVIAEITTGKINADPSCGSHFFHNVASLGLGYVTIGGNDIFRREMLEKCQCSSHGRFVWHYHFESPIEVRISSSGGAVAGLPAKVNLP